MDLYVKPESCKTCPLHGAPGIVWGKGPTNAKMMMVGEAPGEDEAAALEPFVGGSGRVLNALLAHAEVKRSECFVTNVVKCRPTAKGAGGRIVNRQPTETEIRCCAKFLLSELESVNPNVVVALGNVPLHTLTDAKKGIQIMRSVPIQGPKRRSTQDSNNGLTHYKIVPTLHPAAVMRSQDWWPAVVFDLARAGAQSKFPGIVRRPWRNIIHARLSNVGDALRRRIVELGRYGHDLETTGLDPRKDTVRCVGIAAEPSEVFVFDWTSDVQSFLYELHADKQLLTVGQNSEGFDIPFQEHKGFKFEGPTFDTLIGWHLLNSSLPKDLVTIGATVTDEPFWKDDTMYKSGEDALQTGCGKDVHATIRAFEEQILEMEKLGQKDLYFNHIMPVQPILRTMSKRGMKKHERTAIGWHIALNRKADELEQRLKKGLGDASFNVESPKQLMDLLYRRMGLPVQYKETRDGLRPTVDADALEDLSRISNNPILLLVRDIRTLRKWDSTFVMCPHDEHYVVHGHFSTAKAANGRLSSYDPNMQNFPAEVREIFVPDNEDSVFLARDWSQIEWRIAMALAGDKVGLDSLAAGRDAHKDSWSHVFGTPYDEVTKKQRFDAKTINYGVLYGRGIASLAKGKSGGRSGASKSRMENAIPEDLAKTYLTKFFEKYSAYDKFRKEIERQVGHQHYVESAWGRRRYWYTKQNMPEAYNFPISAAAASMMYEVLVELEAQLPTGADLRLTVHDEVVVHSLKDHKVLMQTIECTRDILERAFPQITNASLYPDVVKHYYPNGWFCPSEVHIGTNWKMTKCETDADVLLEQELIKNLGVKL